MYFADHLPPHFHAAYGGAAAVVGIDALAVLHEHLPSCAQGLVVEWGPPSIKHSLGKSGIERSTWNLLAKLPYWNELTVTLNATHGRGNYRMCRSSSLPAQVQWRFEVRQPIQQETAR